MLSVIRFYEDCDYRKRTEDLAEIDWNNCVFQSDNINEMYSNFKHITDNHIDLHIPTKTCYNTTKDKSFMNNTIRRCMRQRNRMY
jgi:hypothetical protein